MIEFKKYSSIENHFYKDYLDQVREQVPADVQWVVQEMSYDVVEDFLKEYSALYNVIDKSEVKIFNKELNKKISALVKSAYMTAH